MDEYGFDDFDIGDDTLFDEGLNDMDFASDGILGDAVDENHNLQRDRVGVTRSGTPGSLRTELDVTQLPKPPVIENIKELLPNAADNLCPVIMGIVAQVDVGVGIDLRKLTSSTRNVEFTMRQAAGAVMRLQEPRATAIVRTSGKITIIGASSIPASRQAAELTVRIIRKALQLKELKAFRYRVRSVMARFDTGSPIRLDELSRHGDGVLCSYEPERFCGCVVRLCGPPSNAWAVTCSVFVTGKVSMIGACSSDELLWAFHTIVPILALYTKKSTGK